MGHESIKNMEIKGKWKEMSSAVSTRDSLHEEQNSIEMFPGAEKD